MQEILSKTELTDVKDDQSPQTEDKSKESISVSAGAEPSDAQSMADNVIADSIDSSEQAPLLPNDDSLERFYKLIKDFFAYPSKDKPTNVPDKQEEQDFCAAFPGIEKEKVEKDPDFILFKGAREQSKDTVSLYKDFLELSASIERKVTERLLAKNATNRSSVGSLSSNERIEGDYFTKEQVLKMSEEQIRRNFDKIRRSQARW